VFNQVIMQIRSDLNQVDSLVRLLFQKMIGKSIMDEETRNWFLDTLLDKIYETHAKIKRFVESLGFNWRDVKDPLESHLHQLKQDYEAIAFLPDFHMRYDGLLDCLKSYRWQVESSLGGMRAAFHEMGWMAAADVSAVDYTIEHRKKFVTARDELEKARRAIDSRDWEEVTNHLRTAIELAIKENCGFTRIISMKAFLDEARDNDLPLPSYDSLYHYYDMGSGRLHAGVINTPFEAIQAVSFVSNFIDALDLVEVSPKKIEAFKKISKTVQ